MRRSPGLEAEFPFFFAGKRRRVSFLCSGKEKKRLPSTPSFSSLVKKKKQGESVCGEANTVREKVEGRKEKEKDGYSFVECTTKRKGRRKGRPGGNGREG